MYGEVALPEASLRRTFLRWTYTLAGISIALSGLIAAGIYRLMGEHGPLSLLAYFERIPKDLQGIALILGGLGILIVMLVLGLLVLNWVEKLHIPLWVIFLGWTAFAAVGGILLSPLFYFAGFALTMKVFLLTGLVFTLTGLLANVIGIDLTRWGGMILGIMITLILMAVINIVLRSEWIEWAWTYGGLVMWLVVAVYAHQLLAKLPMPTEEEIQKGAMWRLAIAGALLLYVIFYVIFVRLLIIALSERGKRRR